MRGESAASALRQPFESLIRRGHYKIWSLGRLVQPDQMFPTRQISSDPGEVKVVRGEPNVHQQQSKGEAFCPDSC